MVLQENSSANACQLMGSKQAMVTSANKQKVAVAMSGGVDSSTTALLLQQAGYDVVGVTAWLVKSGSRCCDTGIVDAAKVCEQLGIEHYAVDLQALFKAEIIDQFHQSYAAGRTPLPCSMCNTVIKWGALLNYGQKQLQAHFLATGHYARLVETKEGLRLARARDPKKDQSYVLWGCTLKQLQDTLLPLGEYTKEEIRSIARKHNLASANRPDSQDLCFIPTSKTTQSYLSEFLPPSCGDIVHVETGKVLGTHQGTHNFTIGQRRGLNIAYKEPLYVVAVDPEKKVVLVGPQQSLLKGELTASSVNWLLENPPGNPFEARAKIRYNSQAVKASITPLSDKQVKVDFHEPQAAITSGQVLGIYDSSDTYLLGGGWID